MRSAVTRSSKHLSILMAWSAARSQVLHHICGCGSPRDPPSEPRHLLPWLPWVSNVSICYRLVSNVSICYRSCRIFPRSHIELDEGSSTATPSLDDRYQGPHYESLRRVAARSRSAKRLLGRAREQQRQRPRLYTIGVAGRPRRRPCLRVDAPLRRQSRISASLSS